MKRYCISHNYGESKEKNKELWMTIKNKGTHIKGEWNGDYWVATYKYNNKKYELWENMEYGIMSEIIEYGKDDAK